MGVLWLLGGVILGIVFWELIFRARRLRGYYVVVEDEEEPGIFYTRFTVPQVDMPKLARRRFITMYNRTSHK